jgi:hypothetical protein
VVGDLVCPVAKNSSRVSLLVRSARGASSIVDRHERIINAYVERVRDANIVEIQYDVSMYVLSGRWAGGVCLCA